MRSFTPNPKLQIMGLVDLSHIDHHYINTIYFTLFGNRRNGLFYTNNDVQSKIMIAQTVD